MNEKFYRSLVRVIAFEGDGVWLHVIGWMPRVSITGEYGNYGIGQADLFTPFYSNNLVS